MSLNIGDALSTGVEKLTTTAGLQLGALYVFAVLLTSVGTDSIVAAVGGPMAAEQSALALPIGLAGGAVLFFVGVIVSVVLTVVVLRTVDHPVGELDSVPPGVTEALPKTVVFLIIAGIILVVAIGIGFILLIIPGLFILTCLYFTQVYIAVEGEGPLEALSSSWALSKGDRFSIFGLILVLGVIGALSGVVGELVGFVNPVTGSLLALVISGFLTIFTTGALVDAYHQLSVEQESEDTLLEQPA